MAKDSYSFNIKLPPGVVRDIKKILREGYYENLNEFIKEAVREKVLNFEIPEEKAEKAEKFTKQQFFYAH